MTPQQEPRRSWADDLDLADIALVTRLLRVNMLFGRVLDDVTSAAGITASDYLVLGVLRLSPDHRSAPTRMCEILGRSTGGMSLTLDRLEATGWVTREPDPAALLQAALVAGSLHLGHEAGFQAS